MKKEKMCFSGQRGKKESALGMNSIKSVDIVSNHLTWTPEGIDHPILKDITLTLEPGHIYGIIGPNGAGKSSFLRHVLAFLKTESKESMKLVMCRLPIIREKSLQGCYPLCRRKQILRQTLRQRRSL